MIDFANYAVNGILLGQLYALVAMGFVVIYRASKVFNFAQGEMVLLGGFLVWAFAQQSALGPVAALGVAMLAGIAIGAVIERVFFSRLVGQSVFAMVMVTVGLIVLMRGLMLMIWGAQERQFPAILPLQPVIVGDFILPTSLLAGGACALVAAAALWWFFNYSRTGLALSAVSEDHEVAQSFGVSVSVAIAIAWMLGSALSVLGASIYLSGKTLTFGVAEIGFTALPLALLAGLESIGGLLLAGMIIGLVQGLTAAYIDTRLGTNFSVVVPYVFMLIVLFVRPTGFFGWTRIERV
jgi:branched-chain amino acid transport system permease protein